MVRRSRRLQLGPPVRPAGPRRGRGLRPHRAESPQGGEGGRGGRQPDEPARPPSRDDEPPSPLSLPRAASRSSDKENGLWLTQHDRSPLAHPERGHRRHPGPRARRPRRPLLHAHERPEAELGPRRRQGPQLPLLDLRLRGRPAAPSDAASASTRRATSTSPTPASSASSCSTATATTCTVVRRAGQGRHAAVGADRRRRGPRRARVRASTRARRRSSCTTPGTAPISEITFTPRPPTGVTIADNQPVRHDRAAASSSATSTASSSDRLRQARQEAGRVRPPGGVAVGEDGTLYVCRLAQLPRPGHRHRTARCCGSYGKPIPADQAVKYNGADRKFGLPSNIAVDDNGYIYVVDGLNSEIVVLDSEGRVRREDRRRRPRRRHVLLSRTASTTPTAASSIADKFNDRVEVFSAPTSPSVGDRRA